LLGLIAVAAVFVPLSQTGATIITIMATTTLTGIMDIGMPGSGTRVIGILVQSRLLWPRIDMQIEAEKKKDSKKEKGCH
jgi:hypothetical protein